MLKAIALLILAASVQAGALIIEPTGSCTKDINEWGNPSRCACPLQTQYNPKTRLCVETLPPQACTPDINQWGHSSGCVCPAGSNYQQEIGICVVD